MRLTLLYFLIGLSSFSKGQLFDRLRDKLHREDYSASMTLVDSCIGKNYQNDSALYYKGIVLLKLHRVKDAHKTYKELVRSFPDFKEAHYLGGLIYFTEEDYAKSVEEFNLVIKHHPNHIKALYNRSIALGILEDYLYAIEDLGVCIKLQPNNPMNYYSRAYWYEYTGNYTEAEKDYTHTIQLDPKNYDSYFGLAFIYQTQKDSVKACEMINRAIASGSQIADELKINFCR